MNVISVITICYNAKNELEKTIQSVASQNYDYIDFVVIDGGSKDGTIGIIKKYENSVSKWISEPDHGIYDAMNKGIGLASGDWIIFMNAGDVFYNNEVVSKLAGKEFNPNTGIIYGDVELDFGKPGKIIKSFAKFNTKDVVTELCHQSVMTNAKILKQIKYDTSFKIMADLNSFRKIYDMGYGFEYVPMVISTFEVTNGISSKKPFVSLNEICKINNISHFSFQYITMYAKALYKMLLLKLLPSDVYNRIRYKKVGSVKKYQPIS